MNWLRLIRWKNLLIVFATQFLVWYCLIYGSQVMFYKSLYEAGQPGHISMQGLMSLPYFITFIFVSLSTLCITAAGYIINDYFDIKIDIINRPDKVVLDKIIPLRTAIIAHVILNVAGIVLALAVASRFHHYEWLALQVVCINLLWFYSTHFKKQYITGNVVVALLTALSIVVVMLYEPLLHPYLDRPGVLRYNEGTAYINPIRMCFGYCYFAFMLTWMREIVKDMEDYQGDSEEGCVTMPIRKGLQFSTRFVQVLGIVTTISLGFIAYYFFTAAYYVLSIYTVALTLLPIGIWCLYVARKTTRLHYHAASRWLKIIMISGICSLVIYHFTLNSLVCKS